METTTSQRTRCYTDNSTASDLPPNIIDIPCKQITRYVIVETTYDAPEDDYLDEHGAILEICEIKVYGKVKIKSKFTEPITITCNMKNLLHCNILKMVFLKDQSLKSVKWKGFSLYEYFRQKTLKNATFEKNIFDYIDAFECKNVEKSNPVDINATYKADS